MVEFNIENKNVDFFSSLKNKLQSKYINLIIFYHDD